jgi:NAD+ synthase (glutamine-hydrolysing)
MPHFGFARVAAAAPALRVADCAFNAERILAMMSRAESQGVEILVFPEMCITGYTCGDLFHQPSLQRAALESLQTIAGRGRECFSGIAMLGLPLVVDDQLFNCAAVLQSGRVLGIVPKSFIPNYKEFYELRWFAPASGANRRTVDLFGSSIPFGTDLLFDSGAEGIVVGVEICEDLWVPIPPSSYQALRGAVILVNLSASNEIIGKAGYRRQLVVNQSGRCIAGYVYSSCGVWESTTDVVFGGHCLVAENGVLLAESRRLQREETLLAADIDVDRLRGDRIRTNSFGESGAGMPGEFRRVPFALQEATPTPALLRKVDAHPFVPTGQDRLDERCQDIFQAQVASLAKRLEHLGTPPVAIGVSGGLDSTLALLVTCKTFDVLKKPRENIRGFTMPGFGTTTRTHGNATSLMKHLDVCAREVDIRSLCLEEMRAMGHAPFGIDLAPLSVDALTARLGEVPVEKRHDLVFENVQARMRTSILMNSGFVIGTGDLSELALGWCTYNADHMNMYNPNCSIPKTLVKFLVRWAAENEFSGEARRVLLDIVATTISPELLPTGADGQSVQCTESAVGPFELHDFFLFHFLRLGAPPERILFLAEQAQFERSYSPREIRQWLQVFVSRFFANQFKRSCLPDGPKVGSVSLSPRSDWRMPSDAQAAVWLHWLGQNA